MRCVLVLLAGLFLATPAAAQVVDLDPVVPGDVDGGSDASGCRPYFEPVWSVDFLVGIPTGVRIQRELGHPDPDHAWVVEGFLGIPTLGGGIRKKVGCWRTEHTEFFIAPGVDAYVAPGGSGSRGLGFFTVDVDFTWRREFWAGGWGEFGVKVGAGALVGELRAGLPVIAVYGGWHF